MTSFSQIEICLLECHKKAGAMCVYWSVSGSKKLVPFQLTITIWITSAPLNCTIWSDPACPFSIPTQFVSCFTNQFTSGLVIVVALTALDHTVRGNWKLVTRSYYEEESNTRSIYNENERD